VIAPERYYYDANIPPESEVNERTVDPAEYVPLDDRVECEEEHANVVSSRVRIGTEDKEFHSPILDIDFPARLLPSSTPGHFHLYLDGLTMPWSTYEPLLDALADAGVIERGYAEASKARRATFVRKPGVTK
jgi:hypothetical protein